MQVDHLGLTLQIECSQLVVAGKQRLQIVGSSDVQMCQTATSTIQYIPTRISCHNDSVFGTNNLTSDFSNSICTVVVSNRITISPIYNNTIIVVVDTECNRRASRLAGNQSRSTTDFLCRSALRQQSKPHCQKSKCQFSLFHENDFLLIFRYLLILKYTLRQYTLQRY